MNLKGYSPYDYDAAVEEKEEIDRKLGGDTFKFPVGRNIVRLLPSMEGQRSPFVMAWMHFVEIAPKKWAVFACPKMEAKRPCVACAQAQKLRTSGSNIDYEQGFKLLPQRKWYANIIDRKHPEQGVQMMAVGKEIMDQINVIRRSDPDYDLTDPIDGIDLIIERTGTTETDTEYTVATRGMKTTPIADTTDEAQALLDERTDPQVRRIPPSDEEIIKRLRGESRGSDRKSGGDGSPASGGQLPPARTAEQDADLELGKTGTGEATDSVNW